MVITPVSEIVRLSTGESWKMPTGDSCGPVLQKLYDTYQKDGFEILDFPCNQFGNQAPGSDEEIVEFCQMKYNTTFRQFSKIDVNGDNEAPLYTYLKSQKGGLLGKKIKWNFTKFLVDREGKVIKRYASTETPEKIEADIKKLL